MIAHRFAFRAPLYLLVSWLSVAGGRAADPAALLPAETPLMIGWSQIVSDPNMLKTEGTYVDALLKFAREQDKDVPLPTAATAMAVLEPLQTGTVAIGFIDLTVSPDSGPAPQLALVARPQRDAAALAAAVRKLAEEFGHRDQIEAAAVAGVTVQRMTSPGMPIAVIFGAHKEHFFLTLGETAAEKVIGVINGGASLAASDELKRARSQVGAQADGAAAMAYIDVQRVITRAKALISEQSGGQLPPQLEPALAELGLNALRSKYVHLDWPKDVLRVSAFAHVDGPYKGLLKLWDQKPLSDEDLKVVPKDAYWAEVTNLNLAQLWQEVNRLIEALAPEQLPAVNGAIAMSTQVLGFSIPDDLLPSLGDTWALYDARANGGLLGTGTVVVATVADREKLQGALERAVELISPQLREQKIELKLKKVTHSGHEVQYVMIAGAPVPVAPAWGYVNNRWVFGLTPQAVAAAMKQADPKSRGESLLDTDALKALPGGIKDAQSVGYVDTHYFDRMLYPFITGAKTAVTSLLGRYGTEIDFACAPPLPELQMKTHDYASVLRRTTEGLTYVGSGNPTPVSLAAAFGVAAAIGGLHENMHSGAHHAQEMQNLKQIGVALLMYADKHDGEFPEDLAALVEAKLLTQSALQTQSGEEYVYIRPANMEDAATTIVAHTPLGPGQTFALYLDGHVAAVRSSDAMRQILAPQKGLEPGDGDEAPAAPAASE